MTKGTTRRARGGGNPRDLYADVTAKIIAELEQGRVPWVQPWDAAPTMPCNAITGRRYLMIQQGRFPKPYKLAPSASRWSEREIVAWIADVKDGFEGKRRKV